MDFDIVIATRNRLDALRISLPLMLAQERLPARFILVDASDDQAGVKRGIERIFTEAGRETRLEIARSAPGSSLQRNAGLRLARSPVVFLPDDDSLWFRGVAQGVMRIYERDRGEQIAAVCPAESSEPPPEAGRILENSSRRNAMRFRSALGEIMNRFERAFFMDPIYLEGHARLRGKAAPAWLAEEHATLFGPMTGFQMTFRTGIIRRCGFDERLGRYSLMEDRDASLHALSDRLIVCANRARVYHNKAPGKRTDDFEWGAINILNRAYVVCKHAPPASSPRLMLNRYSLFRLAVYLLRAGSPEGRRRIRGAWKAIACLDELLGAPVSEVPDKYLSLRARCLAERS